MFRKTQIRLVTLNVLIFVLLINGFGATLYVFMKQYLYTQADKELVQIVSHTQAEQLRGLIMAKKKARGDVDRRIVFLVWDDRGKVLKKAFGETMEVEDLEKFKPTQIGEDGLETVTVNGHPYRVLTEPIHLTVSTEAGVQTAKTLQLVYNLEPEEKMLHSLLFVIGVAELVSIALAVFLGLYLAKKALIPIQLSWEKQQRFIADASHELRTPLSVILVHLERLFRNPEHTIEQESENISVSMQETRRLNKLVSDLLTLARSDSNELQIIQQRVRVDEVVQKSIQTFSQLTMLKGIRMEATVESPLEMVGDEQRLHQLIVILLDNALKYTKENGSIKVICKRDGHSILICVRDNGIGIPKEDIRFIFDRFFRSDKMRSRAEDGTGLGLAIAKWIVDAHGGKIVAESESGEGTSFTVTLPMRNKAIGG